MASISLIKESRWPSTINKKKKWPLTASEVIILSLNFFSIFLITFCNCTSIGCSSHNGRWRPHIFVLIIGPTRTWSVAAILCFSVLCFPRMVNFQSSMEFFSTSFQQIYNQNQTFLKNLNFHARNHEVWKNLNFRAQNYDLIFQAKANIWIFALKLCFRKVEFSRQIWCIEIFEFLC